MRRQIPVTEAEPSVARIAVEKAEALERVVRDAPTLFRVRHAGERIGDCIEVGRDRKAVEFEVVAGVADNGDLAGVDDAGQTG